MRKIRIKIKKVEDSMLLPDGVEWLQVDHLDKTDRGDGGFGSTGK